jgi:hypothetical protein
MSLNTDAISGILGLATTILFWYGRGRWSHLSAMFPNAVLYVMGALSLALIIKSIVRPQIQPVFVEGSKARIVLTAATLLAWAFSMPFLGFYLSSLIFFVIMTIYIAAVGRPITLRNASIWIAIAAVELAVLHFVFTQLLAVQLPMGVFAP